MGVESTALRQGTGLGLGFVVVEDACSSQDGEQHRFAFEKIIPRLCRVRSTNEGPRRTCLTPRANSIDSIHWSGRSLLSPYLGSSWDTVDATVVNVSLSSLAVDLHSSLTTIQWVTSGYLLALALMLPLNGWLIGQLGAKSLYLWCFPIFTLSSALCGLAWSANSLIGFPSRPRTERRF